MVHQLEQLSQRNPLWSTSPLGISSTTLGQAGCYITSFCVVASYYGYKITPPELNQTFVDKGLFASLNEKSPKNLISSDDDLEKVFPSITYVMSLYYPNKPATPANLTILRDLMADPTNTVIVCIDLRNGSVHFAPVVDCDGTTVTIMNVWDGTNRNFKDVYSDPQTNIIRFVVYRGTPASLEPSQQEVTDQLRNERDHNYNLTVALLDRLGFHPTDDLPVDKAVELAGEEIDRLKGENQVLTTRITLLSPPVEVSSINPSAPTSSKAGKKVVSKKGVKPDSIVTVEKTAIKQGITDLLRKWGILV